MITGSRPLVDEEGFCPHGLSINFYRECWQKIEDAGGSVGPLALKTVSRQVVMARDGATRVTVESQRPLERASGKLFYLEVSEGTKAGFYHLPKNGWLMGLATDKSWERLSRSSLLRLEASIIWALRRKKAMHGQSKKLLHGPPPRTIWLNDDVRELMNELDKLAANPKLAKETYRKRERIPLQYRERSLARTAKPVS